MRHHIKISNQSNQTNILLFDFVFDLKMIISFIKLYTMSNIRDSTWGDHDVWVLTIESSWALMWLRYFMVYGHLLVLQSYLIGVWQ